MDLIGDARFVLIGEASHGTHEFYRERAEITKRLIEEKGFTAVAVEADWPDAYRVNRYVRGESDDAGRHRSARRLSSASRRWMWRNAVMLDFVEWLRAYNDALAPGAHEDRLLRSRSLQPPRLDGSRARYLEKVDPEGAKRARDRYACFDHFGDDAQVYGYRAALGLAESCEDEVVRQLVELQRRAIDYARRDGRIAEDEFFYAEQNARAGQERRGVLPHDVSRGGLIMEPARSPHGRDARGAGRAP